MNRIELFRHWWRETFRRDNVQNRVDNLVQEGRSTLSRAVSAGVRAFLVMFMVATPSVLLPGMGPDGKQMVALISLFAGALTFIEYSATYPGLVEFRDAPPFNRIRFSILFMTVFMLTIIEKSQFDPNALAVLVRAVGELIGRAMDFPYSPVRLATLMMAATSSEEQISAVRTAAGMAYLISLIGLAVFVVLLKIYEWPTRWGAFNVWVNMPTFDPTSGGDVVRRLERDARVNVVLGFVLPFVFPAVVRLGSSGFEPLTLTSPQTLIWVMTLWAFLPASLFMRGIAMGKIAEMIREKRRISGAMGLAAA
ncbi:membrane protein [Gemmobacter tilapiae]|uniref:Membrane protein n=2 Tax=Neogemmobacter tilapiae TaxID=875041 RepID=A0A918TXU4_9RHOB|nr:membrane protein [Gemmobacter tilapiae]